MPIDRYKTLAEFRAQIEQFKYDDYVTRPFAPFSELIAARAANQEALVPDASAGELLDLLGSVLEYEQEQHQGKE